MTAEILAGIEAVAEGKMFLCHEVNLLMKRPSEKSIWLTRRQRELLRLVTEGLTNFKIAEKIFLSFETIKPYLKNLIIKPYTKNTFILLKSHWSKN